MVLSSPNHCIWGICTIVTTYLMNTRDWRLVSVSKKWLQCWLLMISCGLNLVYWVFKGIFSNAILHHCLSALYILIFSKNVPVNTCCSNSRCCILWQCKWEPFYNWEIDFFSVLFMKLQSTKSTSYFWLSAPPFRVCLCFLSPSLSLHGGWITSVATAGALAACFSFS